MTYFMYIAKKYGQSIIRGEQHSLYFIDKWGVGSR